MDEIKKELNCLEKNEIVNVIPTVDLLSYIHVMKIWNELWIKLISRTCLKRNN